MADSFFGFDTTLPDDGGLDGDVDDFDALNDETFNNAITGDWEHQHESLVKTDQIDRSGSEEEFDADLDINDFITKFDSIDIRNDETDTRHQFQLDPSVWTTPVKPATPQKEQRKYPGPPPGILPVQQQQQQQIQNNFPFVLVQHQQQVPHQPQQQPAAPKIMSLEEIERSMITQQQQMQHQKQMQEKLAAIAKMTAQSPVPQQPAQVPPPQPQQIIQQPPIRKPMPNQPLQQPLNLPPQQQQQQQAQQGIIFPPSGFPPIPPHLQGPNFNAKFNPMMHPMMGNFHPNFPGGLPMPRPGMPAQMARLPPHLLSMQANPMMFQNQPQNAAQFNQRLVQEIQQNHPMLNPMFNAQQRQQMQMHHNNNNNNNRHQKYGNHINGKPDDYDEYANLMSNRDKQFLITIQLMQLNTETPYFDDFYYTMFKEAKRMKGADKESQAHRDNQMNHPFTQPRGHAQMLLRQFNNISKNGFQNNKNGRERRNSESSQKNEKEPPTPRTYIPLQFENSLGKLQCGSVTAPRKIIDMEIVAMAEIGNQNSSTEVTLQKKSRQIMMHIEILYKIVLKLEDFHIPLAINAMQILKEKREKQRVQLELERKAEENDDGSSAKPAVIIAEPETQTELMIKLLSMMPTDKIPGMMTVRKGRTLLKRIMALLKNTPIRWDIWNAIFLSLTVFKRDKLEEIESSLMPLYYEFAIQLQDADFNDLLKISNNIITSEKLLTYLNGCKFFVSSIIAMFIKGELVYQRADTINHKDEDQWVEFLNKLSSTVTSDRTVDALILNYANNVNRDKTEIEPIIRTVMDHLKRFKSRLTSDEQKLVKLLGIQFDVK